VSKEIPLYPLDIFTPEAVVHARSVDDQLREFAPVVRLADGTVMLGRHEHVAAGLLDWKAFSSASRPWHDPTSPRPEILLTDDPPRRDDRAVSVSFQANPTRSSRAQSRDQAERSRGLCARTRLGFARAGVSTSLDTNGVGEG